MPQLDLSLKSFIAPPPHSDPHSKAPLSRPLKITFTSSSRGRNPIHPATYVQLSYSYADCEIFTETIYTARDFDEEEGGEERGERVYTPTTDDEESGGEGGSCSGSSLYLYSLTIPQDNIARKNCNAGDERDAHVKLYAWKGEKLLGQWDLGTLKGVGILRQPSPA